MGADSNSLESFERAKGVFTLRAPRILATLIVA